MTSAHASPFALSGTRASKADPRLIASDERHFAAIADTLERSISDLSTRLEVARLAPGGIDQAAMDRDLDIHRLTVRLRTLRRFGLDLCLGRMVGKDGAEPVYIGRLGLADSDGRRLLVDWRSPAAEPFFGATHATPMGLASRRRYRWTDGRVTDYWDELFDAAGSAGFDVYPALDDQSAFIASLGASRTPQMRDVLVTIAADQDAVVRAGARGALVVDGGPGTGKTVVALHRTAYLLYSDPRLGHRRGGVLFIGPHQAYLDYVGDVLPSLGEDGVQTCTLRDLVPESATARPERDPYIARLKSSVAMVDAIEPAVALYEEPPTKGLLVETDWGDVRLDPADWADAFQSADAGTPHNEAREQVWDEVVAILADKLAQEVSPDQLRRTLARNDELTDTFDRAWPLIDATDLVGDLWDVPAYLRRCAPWLEIDDVHRLQRDEPQSWTLSDLPLLDAARQRLGDPRESRRRRRRAALAAAEHARMDRVVDELIESDETGMLAQLRQPGVRAALVDEDALPSTDPELLAGPFAHVVVDEAQELTDAEWQMVLRRCPSRSFTIVGDRAQARHGFSQSWQDRLEGAGFDRIELRTLSINYRTPTEVMAAAEPVIRAVVPDANVPTSIRTSGVPVSYRGAADRDRILDAWLAAHADGVACVIGDPTFQTRPRVRSLSPELAKGLEFDLVVLVEPAIPEPGIEASVDRYVAMTRATQELVVLRGTLSPTNE